MPTKPAYYYRQSAVVPYQIRGDQLDIMLVTSRKKKRWIIPKGIIESDLGPQASAAKEALEEAGLQGIVHSKLLGTYSYKKWGGTCEVKVYAMEVRKVQKKWHEDFRDRVWVSPEEAASRVKEKDLKLIIEKLPTEIKAFT